MPKKNVKVYQVVRRGPMWHVHVPDAGPGVHPSQEKAHMIDWACDAAARAAGEVHIRDKGGSIEARYSYTDAASEHSPARTAAE